MVFSIKEAIFKTTYISCYKLLHDVYNGCAAPLMRYPHSSVVAPPPVAGRFRVTVAMLRSAWLKFLIFSA
jgi:hypothetical protein